MADTKISALPASTTPLAGTEVLPIVQSSATKQVSVANLTAGRSFDALGMTLTSTDAGAAAAPLLELYRDSASPAASDTLGEIEFNGEDSAGNKQAYGLIHASILSPTLENSAKVFAKAYACAMGFAPSMSYCVVC